MMAVTQKKPFTEPQFFYLAICLMLLVRFIILYVNGDFHFEIVDMGFIKRILHPEYPQGGVIYDPQLHYNYTVAFVGKIFGYEANSPRLAAIFWLLENSLMLVSLVKLCDFLFRSDKIALVLVIFAFLTQTGDIDQKSMAMPLHLFAIYYFLRKKWTLSGIFAASLFYLHVGIAMWWFLPSCFALGIMFLMKKRRVTLREIAKYSFTVVLLASPVLYYYMIERQNVVGSYFDDVWIYGVYNSVLLLLSDQHPTLIRYFLTVTVFLVGYSKWRKAGGANACIIPIALGVLTVYALDFVLVDLMFNNVALKLQLLRSSLNVEIFALLFVAFLIARQVRRGNYFFFIVLLLLYIAKPHWRTFIAVDKRNAVYIFYAIVAVYECFQSSISSFVGKMSEYVKNKIGIFRPRKVVDRPHRYFQEPVKVVGFIIVLMIAAQIVDTPSIKLYIKTTLGMPSKTNVSKFRSLFGDIVRFTNEKIKDNGVLIVVPFYEYDFEFYTKHRTFVTGGTGYYRNSYNKSAHSSNFAHIVENDLNYTKEKGRKGLTWQKVWRSVDENLIRKWNKEYGVTHVIREKELRLNFPVIYENEHYVVYKL